MPHREKKKLAGGRASGRLSPPPRPTPLRCVHPPAPLSCRIASLRCASLRSGECLLVVIRWLEAASSVGYRLHRFAAPRGMAGDVVSAVEMAICERASYFSATHGSTWSNNVVLRGGFTPGHVFGAANNIFKANPHIK